MEAQYKIIHPVKYYRDYLNHDIRPDGRDFSAFRPVVINSGSLGNCDGSAVVKMGNTTVVCGIKAEIAQPRVISPNHGFIVPNIELTPLCSPKYRPGAPTEEAQIYSKALADIFENAGCVPLENLCIVSGKLVWTLYCDLSCFDHDGCVLDTAVIALGAALKTLTLPQVHYDPDTKECRVDETVRKPIDLKATPVSSSFMVFDDNTIVADPTAEEESLSTSIITIALSSSEICLVHKPGGTPLRDDQLKKCLKYANGRETMICKLQQSITK